LLDALKKIYAFFVAIKVFKNRVTHSVSLKRRHNFYSWMAEGAGRSGGKDGFATFMTIALIALAVSAPYLMPPVYVCCRYNGGNLLSAGTRSAVLF
jgi:hypothetical protein